MVNLKLLKIVLLLFLLENQLRTRHKDLRIQQ